MPRKANPDPMIEEYLARDGVAYRIEAWRNGLWRAYRGDALVAHGREATAVMGYPSNRVQAQAFKEARYQLDRLDEPKG